MTVPLQNVYECLHIVLCITPRGNNFRRYCRMHPTLLSACFIDFYCEWPEAALLAVATTFFRHNQLDKTLTKAKAEASVSTKMNLKYNLGQNVARICVIACIPL